MMNLNDYRAEVTTRFADAWKSDQEQIKKSQASQKLHYDASANEPNRDRVYVYTHQQKGPELPTSLLAHLLDHTEC